MIDTAFIRSIKEGLRQTRKPKEEGTDELSQEYKEMTPGQTDEALDPVNKDAVKKKFKDRKDKDIDNDGDVDSSDEYLHKKRKAISKAMKEMTDAIEALEEKDEVQEARGIRLTPELFKNVKKFGVELEKYAKKSGGIDKDDFMKVAAIAKKGMLPDKSDIPSDTDPRDKVLSMMAGIVGDEILLAFKGLSPSIDNYIKKTMKEETELDEDKKYHYYNLDRGVYRLQKDNNGKIIGKMHDRQKEMRAGFPNADEVLSNTKQAAVKVAKLNKMNEETELDEKKGSDYELYHKTFSGAMQHAYAVAKKRGYTVDKNDIDNKVASGPRKPSSGKTNRYILGTDKKQNLHVQVANLDNKRFELNMYIESVEVAEAPSPNQAAIDAFLKRGGKVKKIEPGTGKEGEKQMKGFKKSFDRAMKKQREIDQRDAKRRYVKGGGKSGDYSMPDYNIVKDMKKFPRSLASGLQKMIPGVKLSNYKIEKTKVPGMGITFPGDSAPKLMIEYRERMFDPGMGKIGADPKFSEPGVDTKTYRKFEMIVYINEAATAKDRKSDRVDWFQRKEFEGKTADEVAKRTLQYLKTKVKRMANEEFVVEREMTDNEMKKREEIVMKLKKKMPEFVKRYGDKAKEVMYATATKMAMGEELEPLETKKSKKKDKINLKPEMDENMRTLKDFRNKMQEHCGECGAMDHVEEGPADYLARKGTFEVKYASSKKGPIKVSKFPSLEQAKKFLAQVRKEGMNGIISKGGKPVKEENEVNEATTEMGIEYGEQEFDSGARLDNAYPNLDANFAKFMEDDLEGPYMFENETYFFDRKMGSWFSVSGEDYVDEDMNKILSHNFVKTELVRQ